MGGSGKQKSPEHSSTQIDLGLDKSKNATHDALEKLKMKLDTVDNLINHASQGFETDLQELIQAGKIKAEQKPNLIAEYKREVNKKIEEIKPEGIDTNEGIALEDFVSNPNNFPELKKIYDAQQSGVPSTEGTISALGAKMEESLKSIADIFHWDIGEPKMRAKIYEGLDWLAKKLGINTKEFVKKFDNGKAKVEVSSTNPEDFSKKTASDLLAKVLEENKSDGPARTYLTQLFPSETFGNLKEVTGDTLTFEDPGNQQKKIYIKISTNSLGRPIFKVNEGKEIEFSGSQEDLLAKLEEEKGDDRNS